MEQPGDHPGRETTRQLTGLREFQIYQGKSATDRPLKRRLADLQTIPDPSAKRALTRVRSAAAAYDLFYDVSPLVEFYTQGHVRDLTHSDLRSKCLVALRIVTLARSADLAHCLPNIWRHQGDHYIRFLDKNCKNRLIRLTGRALDLTAHYLLSVYSSPCPFLFRYISNHFKALTSETLAKLMLDVMHLVGIDTSLFKAHSVRGAAATAFMAGGYPRN